MFSGIVEERGKITKIQEKKNLLVLTVAGKKILGGSKIGDSVAVDGICLTVTKKKGKEVSFDVMYETIRRTTMRYLKAGSYVNLERPLKVSDRISGHFVSGHIDGVGTIQKRISKENYEEYQITIPKELSSHLACKGSVCVDGISLTLGETRGNRFSIYIIPHTLEVTTLGKKMKGDKVNIETDILAKYILASRQNAK